MRLRVSFIAAVLITLATLSGCSGDAAQGPLTVTIRPAPLIIAVHAEGEVKAASTTPLSVPGPAYTRRQLSWVLPDGSQVKKGEVVARFAARQSKQNLAETMIDMARNQLVRKGKLADLTETSGQLRVNLAQVASQLAIANRYANATVEAIARNKILNAIQDKHFLTTKQGILYWRQRQSDVRGKAQLGVVAAKRATLDIKATQAHKDLDSLVLRAPHDGILILQENWRGEKPQVGASYYAGRSFADLPDLDNLQIVLQVPQIQAQGIEPGLVVKLHPLGDPGQTVSSKVSWVAASASPISRRNPVKYLAIKVPLPASAVAKYDWMPGMRFSAQIVLIDAKSTLSVPNLALNTRGDDIRIRVLDGSKIVKRKVTLGVRGPARSQVTAGLKAGDRILLADAAKESSS